ncbi:LAETG motif-containing sortase-dependent surface protein [Streptomyces achromogenes]|uniref:LAETG motif-containing sortase-dependent surface protein n=1 Tax=Streptomyces achromogenes TaxID=67255 RepID=UPI0004C60CB4|nr:LAETG motif-containing sortase-dependent surface protein [Streptomyces achromogenes]
MSLTRRSVRRSGKLLGAAAGSAALILGPAGSALASAIDDFSAAVTCDGGKGAIVVTATDPSATDAVVSVFAQGAAGVETKIGEQPVTGSGQGVRAVFPADWQPGTAYRVHVTAGHRVDQDIRPGLVTPSIPCAAGSGSPLPTARTTLTASPTPAAPVPASPTPAASASTGVSGDGPSPAADDSDLAETGASSRTPLIAGLAAALIVAGAGAVWFGMRRRG